jgi:signal transduction histidine kinase
LGVVEIVAPSDRLDGKEEPVTTALAKTAELLFSSDRRRMADDALRTAEAATRIAQGLLRARTPTTAMAAVVDGLWEHGGLATVGLLPGPEGRWIVVTGPDLTPTEVTRLRRAADRASGGGSDIRLRRRVALILAARGDVSFVSVADAFVMTAGASAGLRRFQRWSARLLEECLGRLSAIDEAERREDQLDLAIACTAHELRNPLLGARAALDHVLRKRGPDRDRTLLQRTRDELRFLEELVEPLLRSFGADEPLSPKPTDLVEVVKDAVTSCSSDRDEPAVRIAAPAHVDVEADPTQLRGAIANVVRNAMEHTPPSGAVSVSVESGGEMARITVEDEGPGVADGFGDAVFRPFVRGPAPHRRDGEGRGLGLFIARRVVEAHGGSIDLDPSPASGAAFRIAIPTSEPRRARSAS